ncbi:hypothetical protein [Rahnella ecdela]|uniref:Uncharacterized protein n=1 Tax=Rahnella ecdela TaxID=2816250 RepID=A0ABS6LMM8_9GAMM|nr:hypothetical protein [Rahnella ecdela]MBU9848075.1 hypothetical protein [Rahnella ecdela]
MDRKNFAKEILCKPYRQPARRLRFSAFIGFAHGASFCEVLQKTSGSPQLTFCLTGCFYLDLFAFRLDQNAERLAPWQTGETSGSLAAQGIAGNDR